jgi:hypothetical protein
MPERDPIDLIRDQLGNADTMASLHADHEAFKQWYSETKIILEKCFSSKSVYTQSFLALKFREIVVKAFGSPEIEKINAARYRRDLENTKNILQGAIKELTLDRTLFKKIPTTPKTVDVPFQGECLLSIGFPEPSMVQAVGQAFEKEGLNLVWSDEMSRKGGTLAQRIERLRRVRIGVFILDTSEEADVLIELGIALGMGKETWVFYRKGTFLFHTLQFLEPKEYGELSELTEKLRQRMKGPK